MQKLLMLGAALIALAAQPSTGLTESSRLASIYDTILHARFDRARSEIAAACPPAPIAACRALTATAVWWRIQLDPEDRSLDATMERDSAQAIAAAKEWTRREPGRAEAWFYLAGAYAPLVQWRVLRHERLAAAREGKTIKDALERSLALDASLHDAYFGIGMYHYYADVVPAALKFLRWLILLPGGDRKQGLEEMLRARDEGVFVRGEADYQLHVLYLWYEQQPARALELLRSLDARYPSNPLFLQRIAEVEDDYRHDTTASERAWQLLIDRAGQGGVEFPEMSAARARVRLGDLLIRRGDHTRAVALVEPIVASRPAAPYGIVARAELVKGRAYERLGDRDRAIAALDAAIAAAPSDDPHDVRAQARAAIARVRSIRAR